MKIKIICILIVLVLPWKVLNIYIEKKNSLSLLFMGDIMGHDSQIQSAFNPSTLKYNYNNVFNKVSYIIKRADFAIGNLEVTLAGKPYKGYPLFSSPDELAEACINNGINVLVTANNHSCDRGKKGVLRTIKVLDSLGIKHTGTFKNLTDREKNNLLILNKNNIKIGILNYTYGTNGLTIPKPTIVNLIDTLTISNDIKKSKKFFLDKLIVIVHWGKEYQSRPSKEQIKLAKFLIKNGVDIVIGSHPHVLQKMIYIQKNKRENEYLIAYSLGNFVSNQRDRKRDGGAILKITLSKENNNTYISKPGYYLTWVNKPLIEGKKKFEIILCSEYESKNFYEIEEKEKIKLFMSDARKLLQKENVNIKEIKVSVPIVKTNLLKPH